MSELDGKVALVTGSARGIGAAIARRLAGEGAAVMVNYVRSAEAAEAVADAIRTAGGKAAVARADVGNPGEAQGLVARTVKELGRLDIVATCDAAREGKYAIDDSLVYRLLGRRARSFSTWLQAHHAAFA
jgi:3-oxoacyl-[acyl-carrier protein] reductase